MAASQSGYPMLTDYGDPSITSNPTVPGSSAEVLGGLKSGVPMIVLLYVAARFNAEVEPLVQDDGVWGFDPQHNTYTSTSNHKSGTAEDLNADRHPIGSSPYASFSTQQIAVIHSIVDACGGVVRWGGDYTGRQDPMHFEINSGLYGTGRVEALAAQIQAGALPNVPAALITATDPRPTDPTPPAEGTITPDLLEWIMSLPGAPDGLTYQRLVADIGDRAAQTVFGTATPYADAYNANANPAPSFKAFLGIFGNYVSSLVAGKTPGK